MRLTRLHLAMLALLGMLLAACGGPSQPAPQQPVATAAAIAPTAQPTPEPFGPPAQTPVVIVTVGEEQKRPDVIPPPAARPGDTVDEVGQEGVGKLRGSQLLCQDGRTTFLITLKGIGPGAADVLIAGLVPRGEWRWLQHASMCAEDNNRVVRFGWVEYPADGAERVIYHLWQQPEFQP